MEDLEERSGTPSSVHIEKLTVGFFYQALAARVKEYVIIGAKAGGVDVARGPVFSASMCQ